MAHRLLAAAVAAAALLVTGGCGTTVGTAGGTAAPNGLAAPTFVTTAGPIAKSGVGIGTSARHWYRLSGGRRCVSTSAFVVQRAGDPAQPAAAELPGRG